ncbi:glucose-inhibited division protein B [Rhodobacteraceae bacterium HTCC2150]|nr:glucose-inhibited division protein B [Rhodobacteraceae bacterium HTCC2150]
MTDQSLKNVSRETMDDLSVFADLLIKWNAKINLVSPKSIDELWHRHIADSVQVFDLVKVEKGLWVDMGTGGGFPGAICAIVAKHKKPEMKFVFIESDTRKSLFLRTVIRELDLNARVENERIEKTQPQNADVVSARALASLDLLLGFADIHLNPNGTAVFLKGAKFQQEIEESLANWQFDVQKVQSETDPDAIILKIKEVERV